MFWIGNERGGAEGLPVVAVDLGEAYVTTDAVDPTTIVIGTRHQAVELRVRGDLLHALSQLHELAERARSVYAAVSGQPPAARTAVMGPNTFGPPADFDQIV